jgi:hypothetical protein
MGHISEARTSLASSDAGAFVAQPAGLGFQTDQQRPYILHLINF